MGYTYDVTLPRLRGQCRIGGGNAVKDNSGRQLHMSSECPPDTTGELTYERTEGM